MERKMLRSSRDDHKNMNASETLKKLKMLEKR